MCHPTPAMLAVLQKNVDAPAQLLDRALQKLDWTLHLDAEAAARAAQDEAEAQASAAIDWHDFTIVETLVFEDAELRGLSLPMSQPELLAFVKATQASAVSAVPQQQQQQQQQGGSGDGDEDMDMDMETDDKPSAAASTASAAPATILPSYSRPTAASTAASAQYDAQSRLMPMVVTICFQVQDRWCAASARPSARSARGHRRAHQGGAFGSKVARRKEELCRQASRRQLRGGHECGPKLGPNGPAPP